MSRKAQSLSPPSSEASGLAVCVKGALCYRYRFRKRARYTRALYYISPPLPLWPHDVFRKRALSYVYRFCKRALHKRSLYIASSAVIGSLCVPQRSPILYTDSAKEPCAINSLFWRVDCDYVLRIIAFCYRYRFCTKALYKRTLYYI